MNENEPNAVNERSEDGFVDAMAAVAAVLIPVIAIIYWLSGM